MSHLTVSRRLVTAMYRCVAAFGIIVGVAAGLPATGRAENFTQGTQVPATTAKLKPGEFVWEPERAPEGPVLVVVSKPEQMAYVYRNGIRIARTTVSTGKPGHGTPTGVFTVLEKEKKHTSTIYKGASMPFMERLTWTGIAMHAGQLPGYPASHGCVRLPLKFSELLYTVTSKGITVIIADEHNAPRETVHPGMVFAEPATGTAPAFNEGGEIVWKPEISPAGPVSILASSASRALIVYRNGVEIGRVPFRASLPKGQHVYSALDGADTEGRRKWIRVDGKPEAHDPSFTELAEAARLPQAFIAGVRSIVTPGTTMVLTDMAVDKSTQSEPDFKVMGLWETAAR
jgi:hypothetical protein